jgi:hypothetical protein
MKRRPRAGTTTIAFRMWLFNIRVSCKELNLCAVPLAQQNIGSMRHAHRTDEG